jgi:protocatechuate 3,4-dioxygenase beta subunit
MKSISRRSFLKFGLFGGFTATLHGRVSSADAGTYQPTPSEVEGPFYPVYPQKDKDFDLTRIAGSSGEATGKIIFIEGRVIDTTGAALEDATVDLWQANAVGRYRHPRDPSRAPLDPNFQGWAIVKSGKNGQFRFKTIMPGAYPASRDWTRPPHIHFKVNKPGYIDLVTQMYFPGQGLNNHDLLLMNKTKAQQERMIAKLVNNEPPTYRYEIVLQKA